jgi:triacylglycerol lipase
MKTIVLAHGLFGFGDLLPGFHLVNYFNEVANKLAQPDLKFIAPQVNPIGSIQDRGDELADDILKDTVPDDRVHIIAHSMGGLDARHVITHRNDVSPRIATLVTIGTPHRGSPVADALVDNTGPLFNQLPQIVAGALAKHAGAIENLTTRFCADFNTNTPDVGRVRYINVAGDASRGSEELVLLKLAAKIGSITGEINDGVVTKNSALRDGNQHLDDWPVDHLGEIGWSFATVVPLVRDKPLQQHIDRYRAIVQLL